jgi:adenosine kinase
MGMDIVLTGSIAIDYLMTFPGRFRDHILPDRLDTLSLSFLVDDLVRRRGGIAANIGYTLGLLGEHPRLMATVGEDFDEYRQWLESHGVDTSGIVTIPGLFTASFFVNTDSVNAQIASFYPGAMGRAADLHFASLNKMPDRAVISANDPQAMIQYAEECRQQSIPYFYDPSQQIVRLSPQALSSGIAGCRALFINDYESALIEEKTGQRVLSLAAQAEFVVITRGEHGADLFFDSKQAHIEAVSPERLVDPTGVGDAFRGGFFKGYMNQLDLETCGKMGALAAAYCLEHSGPQGHAFTLAEFIRRYQAQYGASAAVSKLLP